jgi:hypothetical protein
VTIPTRMTLTKIAMPYFRPFGSNARSAKVMMDGV